ncbi:MAG: PEP-CTERM sorting domain-containing protein [Fimbriiglobus sp.]
MFRRRLTAVAIALGLAAFGSGSAKAGLLPVAVSVTPEAGNYRWTYAIVLPTDSQLQNGNYFTIYDFRGLVPDSAFAPAGWEFTTAKLGPTPALLLPDDNPELPNLSFRYTGPTIDAGQTGLGNFWAVSEFGERTDSFFTARTNRTSDGRFDENITETVVPVPADTTPPPGVPEPTTLALAGLGLPLVALARRRFRKS